MPTKIYGHSDDLIEFDGDINDEAYCEDCDNGRNVLVVTSDGTALRMRYSEDDIWRIEVINAGHLLVRIEVCTVPTKDNYSDIAYFSDGLSHAFVAKSWHTLRKGDRKAGF